MTGSISQLLKENADDVERFSINQKENGVGVKVQNEVKK